MFSVEARKLYGKYWFFIRYHDGYDRPDYIPIFLITEEECEFQGGRFKNYSYGRSKFDNQNFFLKIEVESGYEDNELGSKIEEIINWIDKNIKGVWGCDVMDFITELGIKRTWVLRFSFVLKDDAVLFKLTWSNLETDEPALYLDDSNVVLE